MKNSLINIYALLLIFILFVSISGLCSAVTFAEAESYIENGQYLEAIYAFTTLGEDGIIGRDEAIEQIADIYNIFLDDPITSRKYPVVIVANPPIAPTERFNPPTTIVIA